MPPPSWLPEVWHEEFAERVAIMQHDGGYDALTAYGMADRLYRRRVAASERAGAAGAKISASEMAEKPEGRRGDYTRSGEGGAYAIPFVGSELPFVGKGAC